MNLSGINTKRSVAKVYSFHSVWSGGGVRLVFVGDLTRLERKVLEVLQDLRRRGAEFTDPERSGWVYSYNVGLEKDQFDVAFETKDPAGLMKILEARAKEVGP